MSIVFSCTKGATALCAHVLASRGKLDLDAPVVELWPEFGQNGKEHVTTRMMLDHSVGVPALRAKVKDSGPYEWDYMTGRLADEAPFWEPGTRNGYHGFTFGWTVGEMVRRAAGMSLGTFFQKRSPSRWASTSGSACRRRSSRGSRRSSPYHLQGGRRQRRRSCSISRPTSSRSPSLFFFNVGAWRTKRRQHPRPATPPRSARPTASPMRAAWPACMRRWPMAAAALVDGKTLARMGEVSMATHDDATLRIPTRFALGFMKSMDNRKRSIGAKLFGRGRATA